MGKGLFIVLEGGEGAGKTTQIKLLKEQLPTLMPHREFVFTREPGGSPFADKIRALILSDDAKAANGRTLLGLFMAARADHVANVVLPALEEGKVMLCDRYLAATYAYQVVAQEDPLVEDLFWAHTKLMPKPDATLLFEIDPEVARERLQGRSDERNHFDDREVAFHKRIQSGFEDYFKKDSSQKMIPINGEPSVEEVWNAVKTAVLSVVTP